MNRILNRTIDKYLDISSKEDLDKVVDWVESFQDPKLDDLILGFSEGFRSFLERVDSAYSEFERMISDREKAIKINESELNKLYLTIKNEADQQRSVLDRLGIILNTIDADDDKKNQVSGEGNFGHKQLFNMILQVESLVKSHEKNIDDMRAIFEQSVLIAHSQSLPELEINLRTAIQALIGKDYGAVIYISRHDPNGGRRKWYSTKNEPSKIEKIEAESGQTLEVLGSENKIIGLICFGKASTLENTFDGRYLEKVVALTPIVSSTIEILGFVEMESLKARMEHDLNTAKLVQQTLLPQSDVQLQRCRLHSFLEMASECGGDWWNSYSFEDRDIIILGDVTGHGTASALLTAFARGFFDASVTDWNVKIVEILRGLNSAISSLGKSNKRGMTLVCLDLDYLTNKGRIYSAGHLAPYLLSRADDESPHHLFEPTYLMGPMLGVSDDKDIVFKTHSFDLVDGQKIVLFSDGINESVNTAGREFSLGRLERVLKKQPAEATGKEVLQQIVTNYRLFMGGAKNIDDITMVVVEMDGLDLSVSSIHHNQKKSA